MLCSSACLGSLCVWFEQACRSKQCLRSCHERSRWSVNLLNSTGEVCSMLEPKCILSWYAPSVSPFRSFRPFSPFRPSVPSVRSVRPSVNSVRPFVPSVPSVRPFYRCLRSGRSDCASRSIPILPSQSSIHLTLCFMLFMITSIALMMRSPCAMIRSVA